MRRSEDRTAMIGTESSIKQWEVSYILSFPITNRCIFRRLECICSRTQNREEMDIIRGKRSYKYFKTERSKICSCNFHPIVPNCKNNSYKNRQQCCPFLFHENRRFSKSIVCTDQQGNFGVFTGKRDFNYSQNISQEPSTKSPTCSNKPRRAQASGNWIQWCFKTFANLGGPQEIDLFASRISHQVPAYFSWKLDPYSKGRDVFQMCWTYTKGYAFPPSSLISRVLHKVLIDQVTLILLIPAWQT